MGQFDYLLKGISGLQDSDLQEAEAALNNMSEAERDDVEMVLQKTMTRINELEQQLDAAEAMSEQNHQAVDSLNNTIKEMG